MEVTSILENLTLLNPDLAAASFLGIFARSATDDSTDRKGGTDE